MQLPSPLRVHSSEACSAGKSLIMQNLAPRQGMGMLQMVAFCDAAKWQCMLALADVYMSLAYDHDTGSYCDCETMARF